jgi:hypothetical protein
MEVCRFLYKGASSHQAPNRSFQQSNLDDESSAFFSFHGKLVIAKPLKKNLLYKHHKVNVKSATPVPTHLHDNHPNKKHC